MVVNLDSTRGNFIDGLAYDVETLPHLLYTTQVTIIAVTILANRDIKINLQKYEYK